MAQSEAGKNSESTSNTDTAKTTEAAKTNESAKAAKSSDRRKHKRCNIKVPLKIRADDHHEEIGYSFDISVGGMRAHSKKPFPINSKVYMTLSIPIEDKEDVRKVKFIGQVLRVEEISGDGGAKDALGIKFLSAAEEDMLLLKEFIKKKYCETSKTKKIGPGKKTGVDDDMDEEDLEIQAVDYDDIVPVDFSHLSFFERLLLREDYSDIFIKVSKQFLKGALIVLFLYIFYHIILMILKLTMLH